MTLRWLPRVVLITALLGASGWAILDRDAANALPLCRAGEARSTHAPAAPPSLTAGDSCRACPTSIQRVRPPVIPRPAIAPSGAQPTADPIYWREADVPANGGGGTGQYCVNWKTRFDTWFAGDCL